MQGGAKLVGDVGDENCFRKVDLLNVSSRLRQGEKVFLHLGDVNLCEHGGGSHRHEQRVETLNVVDVERGRLLFEAAQEVGREQASNRRREDHKRATIRDKGREDRHSRARVRGERVEVFVQEECLRCILENKKAQDSVPTCACYYQHKKRGRELPDDGRVDVLAVEGDETKVADG